MLKGPRGEKRLADVIGAAIMAAKIATGEIIEPTEPDDGKDKAAVAMGAQRRCCPGGQPIEEAARRDREESGGEAVGQGPRIK